MKKSAYYVSLVMARPRKGETLETRERKSKVVASGWWVGYDRPTGGDGGDSRRQECSLQIHCLRWRLQDTGLIPGSGRSSGGGNGRRPSIPAWESHGQRSLVGYSPHGRRELDTTEPACRGVVYTAIQTHQTEHLGSVSYVQIILTFFKKGERFIYSALKRR